MIPTREKCSLSNGKDGETISMNTLGAQIEVYMRGCGGKESRKLDLEPPLSKLLLIHPASL